MQVYYDLVDVVGNPIRLCLARENYTMGEGEAFMTIEPDGIVRGETGIYTVLSVNLPYNPVASDWCRRPGHFVLDVDNNSKRFVDQFVGLGAIEVMEASVQAGRSSYPLARIPEELLPSIPDYDHLYHLVRDERKR